MTPSQKRTLQLKDVSIPEKGKVFSISEKEKTPPPITGGSEKQNAWCEHNYLTNSNSKKPFGSNKLRSQSKHTQTERASSRNSG